MKERVYIMTFDDAIHTGIQRQLNQLGAVVLRASHTTTLPAEFHTAELVAVMAAPTTMTRFPSKCLRVCKSMLTARAEGVKIPDAITSYLVGKDVPVVIVRLSIHTLANVSAALSNMHYRDFEHGTWHGPKRIKHKMSQEERQRKKREERRESFGVCNA